MNAITWEAAALTPREIEVLRLLISGSVPKRIARDLGIELWTVRDHFKRMFNKTGVHGMLHLVLWAIRARGLDLGVLEGEAP